MAHKNVMTSSLTPVYRAPTTTRRRSSGPSSDDFDLLAALKGGGIYAPAPAPNPVTTSGYNQPFSKDLIPNYGIGPGGGFAHPDLGPISMGDAIQPLSIVNPEQFSRVFESGLPSGTTGGGSGGGGGAAPGPVEWGAGNYQAFGPNIPDWWKALSPKNKADLERPDVQFSLALNAMIPYLSPEDQVSVARNLYTTWGEGFNQYKDIGLTGTTGKGKANVSKEQSLMGIGGTPALESFFEGPGRADYARQTLDSIASGEGDIGSGGRFLESMLNAISQTGGRRTRASTVEMLGQLDPLLGSAQSGALSPFGPLGSMLANPFFSKFNLQPVSKTQAGNYLFGQASPWLQF